ncbi:Aste57867_20819 [Aphanomyces stellatus]|uniref:Aste57867_20819 protein n=1 Tax=Aphanomyces stellatus TaxID=120398 RepID=A0A485LFX7_9STRA|nr:hypothetical protein As57867_020751 [Aphanomyces stellatus]VFT97498.1 Aste57867_20819 [Aphanomyces stellatus]
MDLLQELEELLAQERNNGAQAPTSTYAHQLSGYAQQEPLLPSENTHPLCLPFPLLPTEKGEVSVEALLACASLDDASAFLWQGNPSRTLIEVPLSLNRMDIKASKATMVLEPTALTYAFESVSVDAKSMAEASNLMLRKPTQLQDYARGKIGNVPFAPGGDSLIQSTATSDGSGATDRRPGKTLATDHMVARALTPTWADELDAFLIPAPGLPHGFSRDDLARLAGVPANDAATTVEPVARATVGVNPSSLLRPYYDVVADEETLKALTRTIADEKAMRGMENNTLSVENLLGDDDDDDLGLADEEPVVEVVESKAPESLLAFETDKNTSSNADFDDIELELLELQPTNATGSSVSGGVLEWASQAEVDVSDFHTKIPDLALKFPFELDSFQKQAIVHLENHDCVFIAAHTSAGKTVVAEYAIAMSQKHMTRTIYTSPIKALSNQKYRDFRTKFGVDNVGLITGDVSINPQASCLVMTTEILRSMLYRGADVIRDIEWVIFDEIHYLNDSERGVVWEEVSKTAKPPSRVIIMLPEHVSMVFLSATTPNTFEFSDWIGRTKQKKIHVISTFKRPVPLGHHLYAGGEIIPVIDERGAFNTAKYTYANQKCKPKDTKPGAAPPRGGSSVANRGRGGGDKADWTKLVRLLQDKELLPVVVFAFSKRLCEESANRLAGLDLSSSSERSEIHVFCAASISRLQGSDQQLPQVLQVRDMLLRGIGVHHGGLLPILKEMVEILFGRGLVKVLFSTETFAMGVNMPARTVVFNGTRKHDGKTFRDLLPGEYTQMAGRAGRRGLDAIGTVIIACWGEVPDSTGLRMMLTGLPTKLESQFRLTYNMILNLLRVEDMTVLVHLEDELEQTHGGQMDLTEVQAFYELTQSTKRSEQHLVQLILNSKYSTTALCIGRVLVFSTPGLPEALAIVLQVNNKITPKTFIALALCSETYAPPEKKVDAFHRGVIEKSEGLSVGDKGSLLGKHYAVLELPETCVQVMTKVGYIDKAPTGVRNLLEKTDVSVLSRAIELLVDVEPKIKYSLDPRQDLKMNELDAVEVYGDIQYQYSLMESNICFNSPFLLPVLSQFAKIAKLRNYLTVMTAALSNHSLALFPDFQQRLSVLTRLGYIAEDNTVQVKGRVACEVNTCEELILTEIIFENVLANLEPEEIVSVLSALIFQEKTQNAITLTPRLTEAQKTVTAIATSLGLIQLEAHLEIDPNEYVKSTLNFGLMEVVYEWSRGMPFKSICELTDVPEGSIVRCITRLDEVCREVRNAARVIGDPRLYRKMEIASESIKRDVVFASSLYLS